jgi:hypothetical protein
MFFFYDGHNSPTKPADRKFFGVLYSERPLAGKRPRSFRRNWSPACSGRGSDMKLGKRSAFHGPTTPWFISSS